MRSVRTLVMASVVLAWSAIGGANSASCQAKVGTAVTFLELVNSPRANGMGLCAVDLVDEHSAFGNPGALGLFHLDKVFAVSFPTNTEWLPDIADDLSLKSWGMSAGVSYRLLSGKPDSRFNAAIGAAYSFMKMSYGTFERTAEQHGQVLETLEAHDEAKLYSIAGSIEYFVRLGFGYTHKRIRSVLAAQGAGAEQGSSDVRFNGHDYGLLLELPVHELLPHKITLDRSSGHYLHFELTPAFGHVRANMGDSVRFYDAAMADPLPKITRNGPSVFLAVDINDACMASLRCVHETQRDLLYPACRIEKKGVEIGFGGTVFLRQGSADDPYGADQLKTKGWGFRLSGIIRWLRLFKVIDVDKGIAGYLAGHLDFSYDWAKYDKTNLDNTEFAKVSISL
jgi:hypothetical protein